MWGAEAATVDGSVWVKRDSPERDGVARLESISYRFEDALLIEALPHYLGNNRLERLWIGPPGIDI